MASINPFTVDTKEIEKATMKSTAASPIGIAIGFDGAPVVTLGATMRGVVKYPALAAGQDFTIVTLGSCCAQAGAAIASVGVPLAVNAASKFIPATTGQKVVAVSLESALANEYLEIEISKEGNA